MTSDCLLPALLNAIRDQLHSVKMMEESLRRLPNRRGKSSSQNLQSGSLSDDDKIRMQLKIDVERLFEKMQGIGISMDNEYANQLILLFSSLNLGDNSPRGTATPPVVEHLNDGALVSSTDSDFLTMKIQNNTNGSST